MARGMLQSRYYTEHDLADFGFKSLGRNIMISSDARVYGAHNISIGNNVRIDDFTILAAVNGSIDIGNYVFIARNSHLGGALGIELHDFSSMAANTVIYSASDDYSGEAMTAQAVPQKYTRFRGGKVVFGRHVIVGSSSTIVGPAVLGEGCSVGAMSLITKDLEPWGVYIGTPARRIKERKKDLLDMEKLLMAEISGASEG
jgi:acetyltransferase-like isoleucine patch superfamily enzyme